METKHILGNGVRVLLEEIPHVHSASVGFWWDTGSRSEVSERAGISHLIEHMMFKGTKRRSALQIAQALEDSGGSLNAFTDKEQTCYYARVLDSKVELAIDVLTDMLLHSVMDPDELRREKQVIVEEIKMYEDTPDELVQDLFTRAFWGDHPLGRAIVGTRSTVRGTTREAIFDYMEQFYTPDRLVVSIAGKFDSKRVLDQLESTVGRIARKPTPLGTRPPVPQQAIKVKYKDIEQAHLCIGTRGARITDADRFPMSVIDAILGGGMSSRLFQEIREKRGMAYTISSYQILYREAGIFGVYAGTSPKNAEQVVALVREETEKLKAGQVSEEELSRAKEQLAGSMLLSLETPRNRMSRMARNELYYGRIVAPQEILDQIHAVTLGDLRRVAREIFRAETTTTTLVGPLRTFKIPA